MQSIWHVFQYEFVHNFKRGGYLFTTFGIPLLAFVFMIGYNALNANSDPQAQAAEILSQFDFEGIKKAGLIDPAGVFPEISTPLEGVLLRYEDDATAAAAMLVSEIDVFYTISADYLETGLVTLHLPSLSLNLVNSQPIEQLFYTTLAGDIDPQLLMGLRQSATFELFNRARAEGDSMVDKDADFITLYFFTIVFIMSVFVTSGYLLQTVIEEKENKVIEVLIASITPTQLLAGKILAVGSIGLIQMLVWVGGALVMLQVALSLPAMQAFSVLFNIRVPFERLPILFAYFVLGYLMFAGLFGAVGALSTSMREGPGYAAFFTIPSVLPFYFFAIFVETPNAPIPTAMSIFPLTAPISMMMRLNIVAVPAEQVILSLGLLGATALGSIWLAGRLFRVQTLLSGKMPRLRDIPKLVQG